MAIKIKYFKTRVTRYPLLALCAVIASIATGLNQGLTKSDWASWVQAVGSIAAIGGALWIFKSDTVIRRTEAQVVASLAAAQYFPRLGHLIEQLEMFQATLSSYEQVDLGPNEISQVSCSLSHMALWSSSELYVLAPLPEQCAMHFSYGLGKLNKASLFIKDFVDHGQIQSCELERKSCATETSMILAEAVKHLGRAAWVMHNEVPDH